MASSNEQLKQSEANLDALRQLDAAIAIAKNELRKSKSDVSTGRDAAADKLSDLEKQKTELLERMKQTQYTGKKPAKGRSSNKDIIQIQRQLAAAKKKLHAARSDRAIAAAKAELKNLKAKKKKILRRRKALAKERAAAKEAEKIDVMEGNAPDTANESDTESDANTAADAQTSAPDGAAPKTYTREAPYEMEFVQPADSHATSMPEKGDCALVHYSAKVSPDWTLIDNSFARQIPVTFTVGSEDVIEGWDYAVKHLGVGQTARFRVPAELAYPKGYPPVVNRNSVIEYELQLLSFSKAKAKT